MGLAHGAAYPEEIARYTATRMDLLQRYGRPGEDLHHPGKIRRLAEACQREHQKHLPDLWREVEGIGESSGVDPLDLLILNGYTDFRDLVQSAPDSGEGCTTLAIAEEQTADGAGIFCQTWDMNASATPHVLVLELHPDDAPSALILSLTGCVGMIGMNEHGVCVGADNLSAAEGVVGLFWVFLIREMLKARSAEEALATLQRHQLAGGHNYLIVGPDGKGFNVELLPQKLHVHPFQEYTVHTNHCFHPDLVPHERIPESPNAGSTAQRSRKRHGVAEEYLQHRMGNLTREDVVRLTRLEMEDPESSVCRRPDPESEIATCGAVIAVPKRGEFWAVQGRPAESEYTCFKLD